MSIENFLPGKTLTFHFPDEEAADMFKTWLCDAGGEQDFWDYMDYHTPGFILEFDYWKNSEMPVKWCELEN